MSADNVMIVKEIIGGYHVYEAWYESSDMVADLGTFSNLRNAFIAAEDYMKENEVEYGISFIPNRNKKDKK